MVSISLVSVLGIVPFARTFSSALEANFEGFLSALVRLTGHGSLVGRELVALDEETIDGDDIAVLEVDDITDVQIVDVDFDWLGFAVWSRARNINLAQIQIG